MASSLSQIYQPLLRQWHPATWEDYLRYRDDPAIDRARLFFSDGWLWVTMGGEGINHSSFRDLFVMLLAFWFSQRSEQTASSFGGCQIEKPGIKAAAPDLTLVYRRGFSPVATRRIALHQFESMAGARSGGRDCRHHAGR